MLCALAALYGRHDRLQTGYIESHRVPETIRYWSQILLQKHALTNGRLLRLPSLSHAQLRPYPRPRRRSRRRESFPFPSNFVYTSIHLSVTRQSSFIPSFLSNNDTFLPL